MAGPGSRRRPSSGDPYRRSGTESAPPSSAPPPSRSPRAKKRQQAKPLSHGASPERNFTLTTAERVRALVAGPPAWAVRKRRIEDLEAAIVRRLREIRDKTGSFPDPWPRAIERQRIELDHLVDDHNRYYPIEANLPCDPRLGGLLEGSEPFRPLERFDVARLVALAARIEDEDG